jgi:hypothetical protein
MYDNEENVTKSVAEAARRVMEGIKAPEVLNEELKGDQHKLDKNKNNKVDAEDFKILRGEKKVNEESCEDEAEEAVDKHEKKMHGKKGEVSKHEKEMHSEETEIEEGTKMQVAQGRTRNVGTYGRAKGSDFGGTDWDKEETGKETKPAKRKYGSRQNFVRSTRVNEGFTDMLSVYNEGGIKSLLESLKNKEIEIEEEATNAEFTAELEKAKAKAEGREKANVAAASVQSVEVKEEVELEERTLTEPEMKKKEDVVKSMKKNLSSFKQRYGDRAKEVMYATATKIAKED